MNKKQEKEVTDRIRQSQERLAQLMDDLMAGKITPKEAKALSAKEDAELAKVKKLAGPLRPLPRLPSLTKRKRIRTIR